MTYAGTVKGNIIELDELVVASIPSSGPGSDQPPKTIAELEREQNMPRERPDYCALASAIWETPEQVAEFEAYVREIRQPQTRRANFTP